jgi:hypothetical protein
MRILLLLAVAIVALMAYVRLAPTDVARWHQLPEGAGLGDNLQAGRFLAVRQITTTPQVVLEAVKEVALATDRTTLLAGSVAEGMMTFQTRTAIWGFPDHTTVAVEGDRLVIYGRLRFGKADLGVNKARVVQWLAALGPLTESL